MTIFEALEMQRGELGSGPSRAGSLLYPITPPCSYLYGGLYGGLYERAHIIRYFPLYRPELGREVLVPDLDDVPGPQLRAAQRAICAWLYGDTACEASRAVGRGP
jgi:hypothetical protein